MADQATPEEEDDYEFELEGVDPEILEHARQRADRQIQDTEARAALLETFDTPSEADTLSLDDFKGFRFTTRHLLIATAVLAVLMSVVKLGGGCNGLLVAALAALAYGWWFVLRKERNERLERERRRLEIDARIAASRKNVEGEPVASTARMAGLEPAEEESAPEKPALSFSFSLKQILWAFAVAAVILGISTWIDPGTASVILGLIAVIGLAIHVMGFELPGIIVFGWWILLVLYVLMSLWAIIGSMGGP